MTERQPTGAGSAVRSPLRLQLSRRKGFNLQRLSLEVNALPAVNVGRPHRWGNPWKIGDQMFDPDRGDFRPVETLADAVEAFRRSVDWDPDAPWFVSETLVAWGGYGPHHLNRKTIRSELAGKNLACWCCLCDLHRAGKPCLVCQGCAPCHADVLLEFACTPETAS